MEYPSFHPKVLVHVAKSNFLLGILFVQYILYCLEQFLSNRIFLLHTVLFQKENADLQLLSSLLFSLISIYAIFDPNL